MKTCVNLLCKVSKNQFQNFIVSLSLVTRFNIFTGENMMNFHRKKKLTSAPFMYLGSFLVKLSARATVFHRCLLITYNTCFEMALKYISDEGEKAYHI